MCFITFLLYFNRLSYLHKIQLHSENKDQAIFPLVCNIFLQSLYMETFQI